MRSIRNGFAALLACLLALTLPVRAADKEVYVFSVVPQFTAAQAFREWQPLLNKLATETGMAFKLKIYDSIPQFESAFLSGEVDFAYMSPYHAVMAKRAQAYVPLVRDAKPLQGILMVRSDGPRELAALEDQPLGFPAPNAFATLYIRAQLWERYGLNIRPVYLKTHSNVFLHVIAGNVIAGGSVRAAFDSEPPDVQKQLRILFETPPVAPHTLAAHPRVPARLREKLTVALLGLLETPEGRDMLKTVRLPNAMRADYARDYAPLEKLKLEKYLAVERD